MNYLNIFTEAFLGTVHWTWRSITFQVAWYTNYFWGLTLISLLVWGLEILFPWRKEQAVFRKDFWLDTAYMFFNFFIFSIVISGFYALLAHFFDQIGITTTSLTISEIRNWHPITQLVLFFVLQDFVQWLTHIALHRFSFLWKFHQIHHSVKEMGFAAHLRYHWAENLFYKPLKVLVVMLIGGFEPEQAYAVHFVTIAIGHLNHSNCKITWGPLKYIFNNPVMHLYHHAYQLPENRFGVNFGISLSLWDYLFRTHYIPESSGKLKLGFPEDTRVSKGFLKQLLHGLYHQKPS